METPEIARHKTAMERVEISRPVRIALQDGIITEQTTVLDYGCGRGGDVTRLKARNIQTEGWDPVHCPDGVKKASSVVNLGYVVNVIEDPNERAETLKKAWEFAEQVLVVSARLEAESRLTGINIYADGCVTKHGTFQKLYQQHELKAWVDATLSADSVPAGPGVFYVFRDEAQRQTFLTSRFRRAVYVPRVNRGSNLYEKNKELLDSLLQFVGERGRLPLEEELKNAAKINKAFGSLKRAATVLRKVVDQTQWEAAEQRRTEDLVVFLALSRFGKRPKLSQLTKPLQADIRAFFTSYQGACELADAWLFSAGNPKEIDRACRESKIGKQTPNALYVHVSALDELSPVLRIYEGCARTYLGMVEGANIIKLHKGEPQISYLHYPEFDSDPHPALSMSILVPLRTFRVEFKDYSQSKNPPILHRKEEFVTTGYSLREQFAQLTKQEVELGLYENTSIIGTRDGWLSVLATKEATITEHTAKRAREDNMFEETIGEGTTD